MALGADRRRIVRTVVRGPFVQTLVGLGIGVPLALAATRLIAAQLYGVDNRNPFVFATTTAVLLGSAVLAAIVPAIRAASVDPARALRGE